MLFSAHTRIGLAASILLLVGSAAIAEPLAAPGDMRLRHDLQLLNDRGVINVPMTAWPISLGDIHNALSIADAGGLSGPEQEALQRVREHLSWELETGTIRPRIQLAAAHNPRIIRSFENTPREEGQATAGLSWMGKRFAVNLSAAYASNPFDGEEFRPDGT